MRALTFTRLGGPDVLEVVDLPIPDPGSGEVRIRVAAATVNPTDIGFRSGRQTAQLTGLTLQPPYIAGMEMAAARGRPELRRGPSAPALLPDLLGRPPARPSGGTKSGAMYTWE